MEPAQSQVNSEAACLITRNCATRRNALKKHTLENLDYYLEQFEANVNARGGKVVWCKEGGGGGRVPGAPGQGEGRPAAREGQVDDQRGDRPERAPRTGGPGGRRDATSANSSFSWPGPVPTTSSRRPLHLTRYDVADLFHEDSRRGRARPCRRSSARSPARCCGRSSWRRTSACRAPISWWPTPARSCTVTNEGNGRMCTTMPRIHVAVAGIEKLIPRAQDLAVFLKLLGRSATGQPLTVYTSFLSGPRRDGRDRRPRGVLRASCWTTAAPACWPTARSASRCTAYAAAPASTTVPVYRKIGGHNYPWVYSGPIGAVISPQFRGIQQDPWLPFASSLCGACAEVCPVKIDFPSFCWTFAARW